MKRWIALIGVVLFFSPFQTYAQTVIDPSLIARAAVDGRVNVIVQLDAPLERAADVRGSLARAVNGRMLSDSAQWVIPFVALEVDSVGLAALAADSRVRAIQPERAYVPALPSSIPVIRADSAWARGIDGTGQVIAVLDTGVEATHSFFGGRVVAEACFSGGGFADSLCPLGDIIQIGAGAASPQKCIGYGGCPHGTHVAGIAVGRSDTGAGVARGANLMAIQVFSLVGSLTAYDSNIISALNYVYSARNVYAISAVNLSLSDGVFQPTACDDENLAMKAAIDLLASVGIPTIIASGNQGYPNGITAPACISSAISVGATTDADSIASFSNRAPMLDLFAPGAGITSSVLNGGFATANGTSMAAPHVAGAFALLKQAYPSAPLDRLIRALQLSGRPIPIDGGTVTRIDVIAALDALGGAPLPNRVQNGDFAAGLTGWYGWDGAILTMPGQWVEWARAAGSSSASLAQDTGIGFGAGVGLEARIDAGNLSGARKRIAVIVHDADWDDFAVCAFWLAPYAFPRTFTLRMTTGMAWERAHLSLYLSPDDSERIRVDNAALRPLLDAPNGVTQCVDPNTPR